MPAGRVELVSKSYMLRGDQVDEIETCTDERPGASFSDVMRDVVDFGLPAYKERQQLLKSLDRKSA